MYWEGVSWGGVNVHFMFKAFGSTPFAHHDGKKIDTDSVFGHFPRLACVSALHVHVATCNLVRGAGSQSSRLGGTPIIMWLNLPFAGLVKMHLPEQAGSHQGWFLLTHCRDQSAGQ